jgi:hypothetical protein
MREISSRYNYIRSRIKLVEVGDRLSDEWNCVDNSIRIVAFSMNVKVRDLSNDHDH